MWEIVVLGVAILILGASALFMAIKSKSAGTINVDSTALAEAIAKAVAKELREVLRDLPRGGIIRARDLSSEDGIQMNEGIIPMKVEAIAAGTNMEGMAKEEVKVDKDLDSNKSKLANLLKKKKE